MNKSNVFHAIVALAIQMVIGLLTGDWWAGTALGAGFFLGREIAQAEYHWIDKFGDGKRENMPLWGGFDYRVWTLDALMDWVAPSLAVVLIALSASFDLTCS